MPFDNRTPFDSCTEWNEVRQANIFLSMKVRPTEILEDLFYTEVTDLRIMLQIMMTLDKDKYDICVRPHPRENRKGWIKLSKGSALTLLFHSGALFSMAE